jgi:hypothetical protein
MTMLKLAPHGNHTRSTDQLLTQGGVNGQLGNFPRIYLGMRWDLSVCSNSDWWVGNETTAQSMLYLTGPTAEADCVAGFKAAYTACKFALENDALRSLLTLPQVAQERIIRTERKLLLSVWNSGLFHLTMQRFCRRVTICRGRVGAKS